MATSHFENGIVATTAGGSSDFYNDIFVTGDVYYVDSVNGNDGNAGTNRTAALATLAQAITNATANNGDVIFFEASHAETLTSSQSFSKAGITFVGLGAGSTKPSFTVNGNIDMFSLDAARNRIIGFQFPAGTASHTARINVAAANCRIEDCDFTCGANDLETITIADAGDDLTVKDCSFTISADGPDAAIEVEAAGVLGLTVESCTFDGGDYDFDAAAINSGVAHTEFMYRENTLSNNASILHTAAAKGICTGTIAGDTSRVEI